MPKRKHKQGGMGKKKGGREPGYFLQPLSRRKAKRQVKAIGRLATRPQRQQLRAEQRASDEARRRIPGYFSEYDRAIGAAGSRTSAAYAKAGEQIGASAKSAGDYAEQLRQRLEGEARADAERRGAAYDPSGAQMNVAAQLARLNAANVLGGVTAAQGAAQGAYYADKRRIGKREKVEQLLRESARRRSIDVDLRELARETRDVRREEFGRLREADRDFYLGQQAAAGNRAEQRTSRAYSRAITKQARLGLKGKRASAGATKAAAAAALEGKQVTAGAFGGQGRGGGGGGRKGPGKKDVRTALSHLRTEYNARQFSRLPRSTVIDYLINRGNSPAAAREAYKRAKQRQRRRQPEREQSAPFGGYRTD